MRKRRRGARTGMNRVSDSLSLLSLIRLKSGCTRAYEVELGIFSAFQEEIIVQRVIHRGPL